LRGLSKTRKEQGLKEEDDDEEGPIVSGPAVPKELQSTLAKLEAAD
jgi:hypothetical protein